MQFQIYKYYVNIIYKDCVSYQNTPEVIPVNLNFMRDT